MGAGLRRRDLLLMAAALPLGVAGGWIFDRLHLMDTRGAGEPAPNGAPGAGGPAPNGAPGAGGPAPNGAPGAGGPAPNGAPVAGGPAPNGAPGAGGPAPNGVPVAGGPAPNGAPGAGGVTSLGGPHYRAGAPARTHLSEGVEGQPLRVEVQLVGMNGRPASGVSIDVWHAEPHGGYDDSTSAYRCRGQVRTDAEGRCTFTTVMPGAYMAPVAGGPLNPHLHLLAMADGYRPFGIQWELPSQPDEQTHQQMPISAFQLRGGNPWTLTMKAELQPA